MTTDKWASSNRAQRLPPDWRARRRRVLRRDRWRCTWIDHTGRCTARATEVDHIHPGTDDHRMAALQSLCAEHHKTKTQREAVHASQQAQHLANTQRKRPQPHPGLHPPREEAP